MPNIVLTPFKKESLEILLIFLVSLVESSSASDDISVRDRAKIPRLTEEVSPWRLVGLGAVGLVSLADGPTLVTVVVSATAETITWWLVAGGTVSMGRLLRVC